MRLLSDGTPGVAALPDRGHSSAESAKGNFEGTLRANGQSETEKTPQAYELQEVMDVP